MSSLRSVIDELEAEDLDRLSDRALEAGLAELQRMARALELQGLRRLTAIGRRRTWQRDGLLSAAAWLSPRFRL